MYVFAEWKDFKYLLLRTLHLEILWDTGTGISSLLEHTFHHSNRGHQNKDQTSSSILARVGITDPSICNMLNRKEQPLDRGSRDPQSCEIPVSNAKR
ncbi:hypothetical protein P5673_031562 [Acropora cervicornis]|uniref:Uncharacterized protein n=1 Tax=Acropora cervicornis TaxID=6130 RepID=A0AAD9PSF7_ACRCE|nr:hypothetical protein P5673_031562 [Acropora cervicornis]